MSYVNHHLRVSAARIAFILASMLMVMAFCAESAPASPQAASQSAKQDLAAVRVRIAEFLITQTVGYPGKVSVAVGAIDPNLRLAQCPDMQVFLPAGSRAWGKTSVGVRCNAPNVWIIYVQSTVSVVAQYLVAAAPLAQGRIVASQDVLFESGDLTQLPAGIFTDMLQVVGRSVNISMNAGTVLRQEMLKIPPVVQQGQTVMVTSIGKGFRVSTEGQALTNANQGGVVQVKLSNGQVVTGIARSGAQVDVGF